MYKTIFSSLILVIFFSSFSIAYSLEENSHNNIESFTGIENTLSETMKDSMLASNTLNADASTIGSTYNIYQAGQEGGVQGAATAFMQDENAMNSIGADSSTFGSAANIYQAGQEGGVQGAATAFMQDENAMNSIGADSSTFGSAANIYQAGQEGGVQGAATAFMQDENAMNSIGADGSAIGTGMAAYSSYNSIQEGNYGDAAVTLLKDENVASGVGSLMGADGGTVSTAVRFVGTAEKLASGDVKGAVSSGAGTAAGYYAGAAIGTAIGGPVGTVVGGMIGSYIGAETSKLMDTMMERNPNIFSEKNIMDSTTGGLSLTYDALKDPQHTVDHWNTEGNKLLDRAGWASDLFAPGVDNIDLSLSDLSDLSLNDVVMPGFEIEVGKNSELCKAANWVGGC
jgi:hypothetical protein